MLHINGNGNGKKVHKCGCAPQNTQQLHFSAVHVSALAEESEPLEETAKKPVRQRLELSYFEASTARIEYLADVYKILSLSLSSPLSRS